jgi:hypothetical protein
MAGLFVYTGGIVVIVIVIVFSVERHTECGAIVTSIMPLKLPQW